MEWTPVSNGLPEIYEKVLVWVEWKDGDEEWIDSWVCPDGDWNVGSANPKNYEVTHFMRIKDPKKEIE